MACKNPLPRWRGFNLLSMFTHNDSGDFSEDDFRWIAGWGFYFVRIPMSYRLWAEGGDYSRASERVLAQVDRVVDLGEKYAIHVMLNLHRAPGYCVNGSADEPFDLWKDDAARGAFCAQWSIFAGRYKGVHSDRLSFNLVNEPPIPGKEMSRGDHARVIRAATDAVRGIDPERLIVIDGVTFGNFPCPELADLGVAQSCRAYLPMGLSHYKAGWVEGADSWFTPIWPGARNYGTPFNASTLFFHYRKWARLMKKGIGVFCGEGGAYRYTPHGVFLRWLEDVLRILTSLGIGYALWNFRGDFGVLDTNRGGVEYERWHGHLLDRKLLDLLQRY
jgi:endoglucanase